MKRERVVSSSLKSAGYDEDKMLLDIEFLDGNVYRYFNVPLELYVAFLEAESHGKYYTKNIRNKFDYKKLENFSA